MSPTLKSSKWRPKGRSWMVTGTSWAFALGSQASWTGTPPQASIGGRVRGNPSDMSGGTGEPRAETAPTGGDTSLLEWRERQLGLWRMTMQARYAVLLAVALVAALPAVAQPHGRWVAASIVFVMVPYNLFWHALMRRTGELSPVLAFSDQVMGVAVLAFAPEMVAPVLLVMLAVNGTAAVAFG